MANTNGPLMPMRAALLLFMAAVIGLLVGGLTMLCVQTLAAAVLAGLSAFGAALVGLHALVG